MVKAIKKSSLRNEKPKAPQSAYYLYKNDVFDSVKKRNPDAKLSDVSRIIAEKYKTLAFDEKKHYEDLASKLKLDYKEKLREYNENHASSSASRNEGNEARPKSKK